MTEDNPIITATQQWLDEIVIGHNFCPFARFVRDPGQIRYRVCNGDAEAVLTTLAGECLYLNDNPDTATTLLMLSHNDFASFDVFLDILDAANGLLQHLELEGVYQLASFHPEYQFEDTQPDDAENYTNRAPYPTLHLLREADIERALADYGEPHTIFEANIATANRLGKAHFDKQLKQIRKQ
ncbi:DUF1415 domain-containing protein [Alteromonas halophila]|uniref:DUF1415 domain-containing protein n=1 Tax=Alteromonas halophila TaxID=516698 RepID=A0A918MYJ3_9ALTE|nr:DUF1415 domain-containing protein [Alteromonas halophila]GGW86306.1 hypothetical protein GCM10007391_19970 [Alteromonas halophila]